MVERASDVNRRRTAARITGCAQDLAEERGLDGFTMDDVATCAGVSRRTLFNYVDGKLDAVLGAPPSPDPSRLVEFRSGGPTGQLAQDVKAVFVPLLDGRSLAQDGLERVRRLMASDARLYKAMHDKFARFATYFAEALVEREGPRLDRLAAHAAATVTLSVFDVALQAYLDDPTRSMGQYFVAAFDGAAFLFGQSS